MTSTETVTYISQQFNRYAPPPVIIFGTIGNLFNIFIFTRPMLINNACSVYFLCSSIANLLVVILGGGLRSLADGFGIDLVTSSVAFCRIRYFILHGAMTLSLWFTVLASVDRYCITSKDVRRRRLSTLKYAFYMSAAAIFIVAILYSHALVLFTIEQLKSGPYCYAQAGTYRIFYDFLYFCTYSLIPPIVMITVTSAMLFNIHTRRTQIAATSTNQKNAVQIRKRDRQLIIMLLIQVIFTFILTIPLAVQKIYSTSTQYQQKSAYTLAVENLITQIMRLLVNLNSSISFCLFTLSGSIYRKEFFGAIKMMISFICGKNNFIYRRAQRRSQTQTMDQSIRMNQTVTLNE